METESEPYVRLASLRQLHRAMADMNTARSLADTLQTVADGVVGALGYELACVNLVRPDGDLVVAALSGNAAAEALITGRVGSRESWDRRLTMGERWGDLVFIPHTEGWVLDEDDVPQWYTDGPAPRFEDEWHPSDRLFAPMYAPGPAGGGTSGELIGVLSVDRPRNGRRPGAWGREAPPDVRLPGRHRDQQRPAALQHAARPRPSGARAAGAAGQRGELPAGLRVRALRHGHRRDGRRPARPHPAHQRRPVPAARAARLRDAPLLLLRPGPPRGHRHPAAHLRRGRPGGAAAGPARRHLCMGLLRNSVVADAADGPRFLLTHVEDIEERKRRELQLAHRASHDSLTGLPNSAELRSRLSARLCSQQPQALPAAVDSMEPYESFDSHDAAFGPPAFDRGHDFDFPPGSDAYDGFDHHVHTVAPAADADDGTKGLAVLFCDLDGFKSINDRFGHNAGDAVLIEVARRLSNGVRDGDTVARLGGDEFVILADGLGRADAQDLAVRLRNEIIQPIRAEGRAVRVGASFGIGWAHCGMTADEVLKSADERMYVEKRSRPKQHRRAG